MSLLNYQQVFHTGVLVADLDRAMDEIGGGLNLSWAAPQDVAGQRVWTPEAGADAWPLRFTYSVDGPQHIELLEGPPGTIWDGAANPGVHHQGVWVDDVAKSAADLVSNGWAMLLAQASVDDGYGGFAYLQAPSGTIIELVSVSVRPRFESWWGGGSFR